MSSSQALASSGEPRSRAPRDALVPLTLLGWRWGLASIVAGVGASFFLFGYAVAYWRNADMDFMVIYNAFLLNDGKAQQFFDHTGYLTILSTKIWFDALHGLGLLPSFSLSTMPKAADLPAFDAAMNSAVRTGRILAWLIATGTVLAFAWLIRAIVRDWRLALIATFAFAFSGGLMVHARILRTELLAACPVILALMILILVGRRASLARPLWMGLAAALCVTGLDNKVQAILLIGALPVLILPFGGPESASVGGWRNARTALPLLIVALLAAIASLWTAWPLITTGFDRALLEQSGLHPLLFDRFGAYQAALLLMIAACMVVYAVMRRISATETLAALAAIATGAALALLPLNIDYNVANVIAVLNPLEKMLTFANEASNVAARDSNIGAAVGVLIDGFAGALARYSFVLHSSPRPTVFLTWLIVPGIVVAWRRGERKVAIQALLLMITAIGVDALGVQRWLKSEYFIITDPLIILAGALLLDRLGDFRFRKAAYPAALVLFALHVVIGQAEPIKQALARRGPEQVCVWNQAYLSQMPLPWCPLPRD